MSALRKLIPLGDRVLIKRIEAISQTAGGVFLPGADKKKESEGEVIAVGPGGRQSDGNLVPVSCQVGDMVLVPEYGGSTIKLGEDEFQLYRDQDILGKFA